MESKKDLSEKWKNILNLLSNEFNKGDVLDIESVIYLIGVQEFGNPNIKFNKETLYGKLFTSKYFPTKTPLRTISTSTILTSDSTYLYSKKKKKKQTKNQKTKKK